MLLVDLISFRVSRGAMRGIGSASSPVVGIQETLARRRKINRSVPYQISGIWKLFLFPDWLHAYRCGDPVLVRSKR